MVEKDYMQRKYARWAKEHIGEVFSAKISATTPEYKADLDDEIKGAALYITNPTNAVLFQHVKIRIESVDLYRAKIFVTTVES